MEIQLAISAATLGDSNTDDENQRYSRAVLAALISAYPTAIVNVDLANDIDSNICCADDEIIDNVCEIASRIWEKEEY